MELAHGRLRAVRQGDGADAPQRRDVADVGEQRLGLEDEEKWRKRACCWSYKYVSSKI